MGLRLAAFGLTFNLLYWISRVTVASALLVGHGASTALATALAAPLALLAIAIRLLPRHRTRLLAVAVVSLATSALLSG